MHVASVVEYNDKSRFGLCNGDEDVAFQASIVQKQYPRNLQEKSEKQV